VLEHGVSGPVAVGVVVGLEVVESSTAIVNGSTRARVASRARICVRQPLRFNNPVSGSLLASLFSASSVWRRSVVSWTVAVVHRSPLGPGT